MRLQVNHKLTLLSGNYSYTFAPSVQMLDLSEKFEVLNLVFAQIMTPQPPIKPLKL